MGPIPPGRCLTRLLGRIDWFVVIGVVGATAFGFLTQTVAPSVATTFSYVNPVVAIILGWLLRPIHTRSQPSVTSATT